MGNNKKEENIGCGEETEYYLGFDCNDNEIFSKCGEFSLTRGEIVLCPSCEAKRNNNHPEETKTKVASDTGEQAIRSRDKTSGCPVQSINEKIEEIKEEIEELEDNLKHTNEDTTLQRLCNIGMRNDLETAKEKLQAYTSAQDVFLKMINDLIFHKSRPDSYNKNTKIINVSDVIELKSQLTDKNKDTRSKDTSISRIGRGE